MVWVIFSLPLWAWDALDPIMVSEHGFYGLNHDEKYDFPSYSVFSEFSWASHDFDYPSKIFS